MLYTSCPASELLNSTHDAIKESEIDECVTIVAEKDDGHDNKKREGNEGLGQFLHHFHARRTTFPATS